jgi:hypothetical protein
MNVILSLVIVLMFAAPPSQPIPAMMDQAEQKLSVPIKDLRNAPATVVINNRSLHLSAYPWRDFTPGGSRPGGSPLMVAVRIASDDKQPLPRDIRLDRVWVLYGEESWEAPLRGRKTGQTEDELIRCPASPTCEISVRGGPRWATGVYVDVVVRLLDSQGQAYFIQAPNQFVRATS